MMLPDVLNNLPENVLDDILSRLPLRDAVRTSVLSKNWRCNWCRLPVLTLDKTFWDKTNRYIPFVTRFTDIIYHLLALHVGPITKFTLSISSMESYLKIDYLMSFLSRNGIRHLALQFPEDEPYKLPSSFFTCLQMSHLSLCDCSIQLPPSFKGFNKLVSLELHEVTISCDMLATLISHSLMLEKLVLEISNVFYYIQVNAPKLKSFDFTGDIVILSFNKLPCLVKLSFYDKGELRSVAGQPDLTKYFESFPALEHLQLNCISVQFLSAGLDHKAAKLSSPLNCLTCLCLSDICLDELDDLSIALCLIRSSPYLQDIQIEVDYLEPHNAANEIPADVTLDHLRYVKLEGITGTKIEIKFIKLLLAKSPMLVRMLIQTEMANESAETRLKELAKMTKFPRASPKAEVDYM